MRPSTVVIIVALGSTAVPARAADPLARWRSGKSTVASPGGSGAPGRSKLPGVLGRWRRGRSSTQVAPRHSEPAAPARPVLSRHPFSADGPRTYTTTSTATLDGETYPTSTRVEVIEPVLATASVDQHQTVFVNHSGLGVDVTSRHVNTPSGLTTSVLPHGAGPSSPAALDIPLIGGLPPDLHLGKSWKVRATTSTTADGTVTESLKATVVREGEWMDRSFRIQPSFVVHVERQRTTVRGGVTAESTTTSETHRLVKDVGTVRALIESTTRLPGGRVMTARIDRTLQD